MAARRFPAFKPPSRLEMWHERRARERDTGFEAPVAETSWLAGALKRLVGSRGEL